MSGQDQQQGLTVHVLDRELDGADQSPDRGECLEVVVSRRPIAAARVAGSRSRLCQRRIKADGVWVSLYVRVLRSAHKPAGNGGIS